MRARFAQILVVAAAASMCGENEVYVSSYTRKSGREVKAHCKTKPDKSLCNNYSAKGNINPHTLQNGASNPNICDPIPSKTPLQQTEPKR